MSGLTVGASHAAILLTFGTARVARIWLTRGCCACPAAGPRRAARRTVTTCPSVRYGPKCGYVMYIIIARSCSQNGASTVHSFPMKTHIELDDKLLEEIFELGGFATKKAAVNTALSEYAKMLKRRELLAMRGQVRWEGDLAALRADRRGRRP